MTDNVEPLNMHGHANTWEEELLEVAQERDELRAENGRLRTDREQIFIENERLRTATELAFAENDTLRAALKNLLRQCNRDLGGLHEGPLSDARREARAALG